MEALKIDYFVDGFLIKHFNVYPLSFDKDNLFEEQKMFLIWLMGSIPSIEDWSIQVRYKKERDRIENLKSVHISGSDLDLARMQKKDISILKKERLLQEQKRLIEELNEKFGMKEEEKEQPEEINTDEINKNPEKDRQARLWELLNGKSLIK